MILNVFQRAILWQLSEELAYFLFGCLHIYFLLTENYIIFDCKLRFPFKASRNDRQCRIVSIAKSPKDLAESFLQRVICCYGQLKLTTGSICRTVRLNTYFRHFN